ncbi:MAG: DUF4124 domain-containing protein [Chromatiales bacterium]|nr:DUF4124 domain-containing protein [Chromatiales bacterium]
MHRAFIFLALALAATAGSADVYRWTDSSGQTHYSDRPQPGAERITITVTRPASGAPDGSSRSGSNQQPAGETPAPVDRYQTLIITSPAQEQVLWNIEGQLDVAATVQPPLQPGHALRFTLDGRTVTAEPGSTRAQFPEVFRGEHSLQVEVVDDQGRPLVASPTTRFFVRQTALPNPVPAARP